MQAGKQSFSYQELQDQIEVAIGSLGLTQIKIEELIKELTEANGIFRRKTREEYDFAHLTFQEYFAALQLQSLNDPEREQLWREKLHQDPWREVLLFYSQLCDSPGKIVEEALRSGDVWYAAELALCAAGRLPERIRQQILHLITDQLLKEAAKQFGLKKVDLINDLSRDGIDFDAYEKIGLLFKKIGDKIPPELMELKKKLTEFLK